MVAVSTRERPVDRGRRLATADRIRIGHELRVARQVVGESVHVVGSAIEMSGMQVSRIERGILPTVSIEQLARLGAAVGLDVRVRAYPGPSPVLDAAQMALLGRLRARLPKHLLFRTEVPLPSVGDQRAWDAYISRLVGIADACSRSRPRRGSSMAKHNSGGSRSSSGTVDWNTFSSSWPTPDETATCSAAHRRSSTGTSQCHLGEPSPRYPQVTIPVARP